jgi:hypothetical protein
VLVANLRQLVPIDLAILAAAMAAYVDALAVGTFRLRKIGAWRRVRV